jgi:hypothetical protein
MERRVQLESLVKMRSGAGNEDEAVNFHLYLRF